MPAHTVILGREAGRQVLHDVGRGPAQLGRRDIGDTPLTRRVRRAAQPARRVHAAQHRARRMAFPAMGHRLGDIAATFGRGGKRTGQRPILVQIQQLPDANGLAKRKGKANLMRQAWRGICGQGLQKGMQVGHILQLHLGIGRIGQGGIVMRALRADTAGDRIGHIQKAPPADALIGVLADVGGDEGAEIRREPLPTDKHEFSRALCPLGHVARGAA